MTPSDSKKLMSLGDGFIRTLREKPRQGSRWKAALLVSLFVPVYFVIVVVVAIVHTRYKETATDATASFRAGDVVPASVERVMGGVCRFGQDVFVVWKSDSTVSVTALDPNKPALRCLPNNGVMSAVGMPTTFYTEGEIVDFEEGTNI